ncbi:MAG: hypothetical protein CME63_09720 [Halobacteriovoraceae bacterium]|nr:hypothetical protein [Halobacteriovoraceae bacterium]
MRIILSELGEYVKKEIDNKVFEFLKENTFNNVDILLSNREILRLDFDSLYQKIKVRKRGGYCFELNELFYRLQIKDGQDIQRVLARVTYGESSENKPRTHQMSIINIMGGLYLVDVGFGPYAPTCSIPLNGEVVEDFYQKKFIVRKGKNDTFQLGVLKDEGFFSLYEFDLNQYRQPDFELANYYTNTHNDSKFTNNLLMAQFSDKKISFFNNLVFSVIENGEREDRNIDSAEDFFKVLSRSFTLKLSREECLKLFRIVKNQNRHG